MSTEIIQIQATGSSLDVLESGVVTTGSVAVHTVQFTFDETWDGLSRVAVFQTTAGERSVVLDDTNSCTIPYEVLAADAAGGPLYVGVYGTRITDGETVQIRPTAWAAAVSCVAKGADPDAEETVDPTPTQYEQMLSLSAAAEHPPEIGEGGTWLVWDLVSGAYADTGISATGPQGSRGYSGNFPLAADAASTEVTLEAAANTEYVYSAGLSSLTLTFGAADPDYSTQYLVNFLAGAADPAVGCPAGVQWSPAVPVFTAGLWYRLGFTPLGSGYAATWEAWENA